jgi:hypothetical protein
LITLCSKHICVLSTTNRHPIVLQHELLSLAVDGFLVR